MNNYKAVIIGSNADNTLFLKKNISQNHPEISIVAEVDSIDVAKEVLLKHKPHIALMDIELECGTAFDLLQDIFPMGSIDFETILFTRTPCFENALKAIDFSTVALLTHPVNPDILRGAMDKAIARQTKRMQLDQLLKSHLADNVPNNRILVSSVNHTKIAVSIADITYLKAEGQTTVVYFNEGSSLTAFCILGHFKKILLEAHPFFLVHNSILVNVSQIRSFRYNELEITLKNGKKLLASRRFGKEFKKYWDEFNSGASAFRLESQHHQAGVATK